MKSSQGQRNSQRAQRQPMGRGRAARPCLVVLRRCLRVDDFVERAVLGEIAQGLELGFDAVQPCESPGNSMHSIHGRPGRVNQVTRQRGDSRSRFVFRGRLTDLGDDTDPNRASQKSGRHPQGSRSRQQRALRRRNLQPLQNSQGPPQCRHR